MNLSTFDDLLSALVPEDGAPVHDFMGHAYPLPKSLPLTRQVKVARLFESITGAPPVRAVFAAFGAGDDTERRLLSMALTAARDELAAVQNPDGPEDGDAVAEAEAKVATLEQALADQPKPPTLLEAFRGLLEDEQTIQRVVDAFEAAHPAVVKRAVQAAQEAGDEAEGAADVFSGEAMLLEGLVPFFALAARAMVAKAGMLERIAKGQPVLPRTSPSGE